MKKIIILAFFFIGGLSIQIAFAQRYYSRNGYYDERRRSRKAEGFLGGAAGGALLGGIIGGGKGAGYGALAGGLIGLAAGSEADRRARYYEDYKPVIYKYGNVDGYMVYYFNDENNEPVYFFYDEYGRKRYVDLQ